MPAHPTRPHGPGHAHPPHRLHHERTRPPTRPPSCPDSTSSHEGMTGTPPATTTGAALNPEHPTARVTTTPQATAVAIALAHLLRDHDPAPPGPGRPDHAPPTTTGGKAAGTADQTPKPPVHPVRPRHRRQPSPP